MKINEIEKLAGVMAQHSLTELSIESEDMKLVLKRGGEGAPGFQAPVWQPGPMSAPAVSTAPGNETAETQEQTDDAAKENGTFIRSPIVGTFYNAPSPDADAYVNVGDQVTEDTVVCIIEAMKVMNEIKAETHGTIREVLVDNGTPVEYNQPLFAIDIGSE